MDEFGIPGTTRASFAFYNTRAEVNALVEALLDITAVDELQKAAALQDPDAAEQPVPPHQQGIALVNAGDGTT